MLVKWLVLLLLLTGLIMLVYLQNGFVGGPRFDIDNAPKLADKFVQEAELDTKIPRIINSANSNVTKSTQRQSGSKVASNNQKKIEIYGRVIDQDNRPIENVLVSEDEYFYYSRSDSEGNYRLALEIPKHRFPKLNFLRSGYEGKKFDLANGASVNDVQMELNVTLLESIESISVGGWIGNENGENLPGQKIGLYSSGNQGLKDIDRTVVSDGNGEFVFEAVIPDVDYQLEVYTSEQYAPYSVQDLILTRTTPRLNITLSKLKFIQVSGMFVDIEGAPVPDFEIDMINVSTGIHVRRIKTDSSGFFYQENFPTGEIRFLSRPPEHFRINGLRLAEYESKPLKLVVDKGGYQISGWISDQNGLAVDRAMVMFDAEVEREGIKSVSNRSTVTDSNGYFRFGELANTPHQITIYARGFKKKELLHHFQSHSSEVYIPLTPQ